MRDAEWKVLGIAFSETSLLINQGMKVEANIYNG